MSDTKLGVSATLIVKNEEHTLRDCLQSLHWVDDIIILDAGSSDDTLAIAREFTPHVYSTDWPGFGIQRHRALEHARSEWVLVIDADERVSADLAAEIQATLPTSTIAAYRIPFRSTYLDRVIRFGDWRAERHVRLFRRSQGRFTTDHIHERLIIDGPIGDLQHDIQHHSFINLEEVLEKTNRYSSAGAQQRFERGEKSSMLRAISHSLWTFLRGYIFRLGFLDGRAGFLLALSNASGTFYRYVKLLYLQEHHRR